MEEALEKIRELAVEGNEQTRRGLMLSLQALSFSLETPQDTIHRFGHMNLQAAVVQVGIDLGLFKFIAKSAEPVTVDQVSENTGAEPQLARRLLRFLASIAAVKETESDQYAANNVTRNLTEELVEAGLSHYFGTAAPQYQALPGYLEQTGYKNPVDENWTAFRVAFQTDKDAFSWFADHPTHLAHFNSYMALRRKPDKTWLSIYPVAEEASSSSGGLSAERVLYVNIGGGVGHQCAQFVDMFPDLPGRVVLQDLPHSIAQALPTPGVENMAHDMFAPQPAIGAKFYYLRAVLHNHPPHRVRQVLANIKAAMQPDSVLIVDEMVFPEVGVNFNASCIDLTMLSAFASMERTEAQWRDMFENVGLRLVKTYTYNPASYESAMDVRLG